MWECGPEFFASVQRYSVLNCAEFDDLDSFLKSNTTGIEDSSSLQRFLYKANRWSATSEDEPAPTKRAVKLPALPPHLQKALDDVQVCDPADFMEAMSSLNNFIIQAIKKQFPGACVPCATIGISSVTEDYFHDISRCQTAMALRIDTEEEFIGKYLDGSTGELFKQIFRNADSYRASQRGRGRLRRGGSHRRGRVPQA